MTYWRSHFSHLYAERRALDYPLAQRLLRRFPSATVVPIDDYKELFARPRQHFQMQKRSMKLILAVKKDNLLYPGSHHAQDFGYPNFFYNTPVINCIYNCDYCYLQGKYPSANLVVFVNQSDFFAATKTAIQSRADPASPLYLALSYDTDLLAFESRVPFCRDWIEFTRREPELIVEIRTKSANFRHLRKVEPCSRVILAWTLSPDIVVSRYEKATPTLSRRLESARQALDSGWPVRLCLDPIMEIPQWRRIYEECIERVFSTLAPDQIRDVSVGSFRMNKDQYDRIRRQRPNSDIYYRDYDNRQGTVTYPRQVGREMTDIVCAFLERYINPERIAVWN